MQNIYSVAQVNSYIKNMFGQDYMLREISVRGEVSNVKYHSSGHIYFTIKDEKGTLACVMFKGSSAGLSFKMQEGQQIVASGSIDVYERDGKYQLYARKISLDGGGILYEKFLKLKDELEEMGMFSNEYKQPIPKYSKVVGVVTAPTGAAIRDIIQIIKRRNPYVQIVLYPAIVQGDAAAKSIVEGILALEEYGVDVMIVGRGGGSIEDLWAFNERIVAETVFNCRIPVISAVGHETDTTIIDYVSDLRAPTPSGAAELAVAELHQIYEIMSVYKARMTKNMSYRIRSKQDKVSTYKLRFDHQNPLYKIREQRMYALSMEEKFRKSIDNRILDKRHNMDVYIARLKGASPLEKLNQGYGFVTDDHGTCIKDVKAVQKGDLVKITLKNGSLKASVTEVLKEVGL